MPQPNVKAVQVAGPLANVSVAYRPTGHIADRVFPIIDKVPFGAKIGRYLKGAWFRDEAGIRAPGTRSARGGYPTDFLDVSPREYSFAREVTDEDREVAKQQGSMPLMPDQDAVEFAAGKVDLKKEVRIKELVVNTVWSDGNSGGEDAEGLWAAGANNTFLDDIAKGISTIHGGTGIKPNKLIIDLGTFLSLKKEATVLDKIKYTERGILTSDLLAALLELEEVLIGEAIQNTAKETKAGTEFTAKKIWEVNATKGMGFLFYAPPRPGLKTPSAGYQARSAYANGLPRRTEMWREPAEHQDVYEVAENTHILSVGADLGYLWKDTLLT
jgi:hypothetical protein